MISFTKRTKHYAIYFMLIAEEDIHFEIDAYEFDKGRKCTVSFDNYQDAMKYYKDLCRRGAEMYGEA